MLMLQDIGRYHPAGAPCWNLLHTKPRDRLSGLGLIEECRGGRASLTDLGRAALAQSVEKNK